MNEKAAYTIVSLYDRHDLIELTARWRWLGYFKARGATFQEMLLAERRRAACRHGLPSTLILLEEGEPVGMVSLAENDLKARSDLNPWLADMFVDVPFRGRGHAQRLVRALESEARSQGINRLWLFTADAAGLYAKVGWTAVDMAVDDGHQVTIMRRDL